MLKSRAWRRLLPDVYVATAAYASGDHRMWCSAAALAIPPGAALGGWSAAYLHGVDVLPQDARVWINLPLPGRIRPPRPGEGAPAPRAGRPPHADVSPRAGRVRRHPRHHPAAHGLRPGPASP